MGRLVQWHECQLDQQHNGRLVGYTHWFIHLSVTFEDILFQRRKVVFHLHHCPCLTRWILSHLGSLKRHHGPLLPPDAKVELCFDHHLGASPMWTDVVSHCIHNCLLPSFPLNQVSLHCLLIVCCSLVEPLAMALFNVTDELAKTILVIWLDEPNL
jgi:hypothetical protein